MTLPKASLPTSLAGGDNSGGDSGGVNQSQPLQLDPIYAPWPLLSDDISECGLLLLRGI